MDRNGAVNLSDNILYKIRSNIMIGETIIMVGFWIVAIWVSYDLNKELHRDIHNEN